jgi:alpha-L-fucosidase
VILVWQNDLLVGHTEIFTNKYNKMKRLLSMMAAILVISTFNSFDAGAQKTGTQKAGMNNLYQQRLDRTEWFRNDRFGMFIHWGIYAIPARGEWVRSQEKMSIEDYQPYFEQFNPVNYNPHEWAKLAKQAGMKYAVITTKHHDGFCLFDSKLTDYKATNTPAGRDLIREFVDAFRAEGLKVGFYYSLIDWHHPDYPAWGDRQHPMRDNEDYREQKYEWDRYLEYMHGQVRELCTNYGKIDIMWFDFSYSGFSGEKWKAAELVRMVREIQPGVIIDNRLGGDMERADPEPYAGDFEGPEQYIPVRGVFDEAGRPLPWEVCMTLNNHWGYASNDHDYKTAGDVIRALVNCASKGGNLLLNVGPTALGVIPPESIEILEKVGSWMEVNGQSIYQCGRADCPKPDWGRFTQNGNLLYAHVMEQNIGQICAEGLRGKVGRAWLLRDGSEVLMGGFWNGEDKPYVRPDDLFLSLGKPLPHTHKIPDPTDTVIVLELNGEEKE